MILNPGHQEALRRHIVIDNINRVVWIQVLNNIKGHPRVQEVKDLTGDLTFHNYRKYLPADIRDQITKEVNNGYQVKPMYNYGFKNEEYYIIQMVDIGINESMLKPVG